MKHWKRIAWWLTILPAVVLTACSPALEYRAPRLNAADEKRLTCSDYPDFLTALRALPEHQWLASSSGQVVTTPDGNSWVAFKVVQEREAKLLAFAGVTAKGAHFECRDNLLWLADVLRDLQR